MTNVVLTGSGDVFSIRVIKSHTQNPLLRWANTYELATRAAVGAQELTVALDNIVQYERLFHLPTTRFEYGTVSTFVPDSQPYNANEFLRRSYASVGNRVGGLGEPASLENCLRVAFSTLSGRTGFRLYRNVLREEDIGAPAGKAALSNLPLINQMVLDARTDGGLDNQILGMGEAQTHLVLASGLTVRPVADVTVAGVTIKKLNNKWFNRAPRP